MSQTINISNSTYLICGDDLYRFCDHGIAYLGKVVKTESWRLYTFIGYIDANGIPDAVIDESENIVISEIIEVAAIRA